MNYILLYLHQGKFDILKDLDSDIVFDQVKKRKNEATAESLCGIKSQIFLPFTQQVMNIGFEE